MGHLSLQINSPECGKSSIMNFDPTMTINHVCRLIRDKFFREVTNGFSDNGSDYGLFRVESDKTKCVWMEGSKTLEHYLIRNQDVLEYKNKMRQIKIRTLDGTVKTAIVDESQTIAELMMPICNKIGISNHEEYSLTKDSLLSGVSTMKINGSGTYDPRSAAPAKKSGIESNIFGTLGRKKEKKMENLRLKNHTDEELDWIDHNKTLREQGIEEEDVLVLRRRYYFSDANVERDPKQLNLLYVQCKEDVLKGLHPVNKDIAYRLAALQAFIEFGPYSERNNIDFKAFLPKEYAKQKDLDKHVLACYQHLQFEEPYSEPRKSYINECKDLYTYGVTFFVVKEKVKGRNKLVPILLGINKDCIMRLDAKTKEVIKEYPLEQVRRFVGNNKCITLDFGDYQEGYYSAQTTDGKKIDDLIAGYIDIIIKKQKMKDHLGIEGDEGSTMLEDRVAPARATLIAHGMINGQGMPVEDGRVALPGVYRSAGQGQMGSSNGLNGAQYGAVSGQILTKSMPQGHRIRVTDSQERSQRALLGTIEATKRAVEEAEEELYNPPEIKLPKFDDPSSRRWIEEQTRTQKEGVAERISAMGAATAEVVQLTAVVDETDTRVGSAIATIGSNMPEMGRNVRELAHLMYDERRSETLVESARNLCQSLKGFLDTVEPTSEPQSRKHVLEAASRVGEYSKQVMNTMEEQTIEHRLFQDQLVDKAKSVATSAARLVLQAKNVSAECPEPEIKDRVIQSATQCAFATSQLVACTRVVGSMIANPECQYQLSNAATHVSSAVTTLIEESDVACTTITTGNGPRYNMDIHAAARAVTSALDDLLEHSKTSPKQHKVQQDSAYDHMMRSSNRLISTQHSTQDMVRQSESAIRHSRIIVEQMESEAQEQSPEQREKLLSAARSVAQATSHMIDATKQCQSRPQEAEHQVHLKTAAEQLVNATSEALSSKNSERILQSLEQAARKTAASATQTIGAVSQAIPHINNRSVTETLIVECTETAEVLPRLKESIKQSQSAVTEADRFTAQSRLAHDVSKIIPQTTKFVEVTRRAVHSVQNQDLAENLQKFSQQLNENISELRVAFNNAQQSNYDLTLVRSEDLISKLDQDLVSISQAYSAGTLLPLPYQKAETSASEVVQSARSLGSSLAQLVSAEASSDRHHLGSSAVEVAHCLREFTSSIHSVCASRKTTPVLEIVNKARSVVHDSGIIYEKVRAHSEQQQLAEACRTVTISLKKCLDLLPDNIVVDKAIDQVRNIETSITIQPTSQPITIEDIREKADKVIETNGHLLVNMIAPEQGAVVECFATAYTDFHTTVKKAIIVNRGAPELKAKQQINLDLTKEEACTILSKVKASINELSAAPQIKQELIQSTRKLTEIVNVIVEEFSSQQQSPWITECDNSLRQIESCRHLLDNALYPINNKGYYESLESVTEQAKKLGEGMKGIARNAKAVDTESLCESVHIAAEAVCGLVEAAAQSAYLVGVAEPSSVPGKQALFDSQSFESSLSVVKRICSDIQQEKYVRASLIGDTTVLASHTSALSNLCREMSMQALNVNSKKQFIQYGTDLVTSTASFIKSVKDVDRDFASHTNKIDLVEKTYAVQHAAENLEAFTKGNEFIPIPAKISARGAEAQKPVLTSGRQMLFATCEMFKTAKALALSPKDASTWQKLADNSTVVSESIKKLVSAIRDEAPGQNDLDASITRLRTLMQSIETSSMAAYQGQLPQSSISEQRVQQQIIHASQSIIDRIDTFKEAANNASEKISHEVRENMLAMESLVQSGIHAASYAVDNRVQNDLFNLCKTVVESEFQFMHAAKDAGGNPQATELHKIVNEKSYLVSDALNELQRYVRVMESEAGVIHGMVDSISRSIQMTDQTRHIDQQSTFADSQTRMISALEAINKIATDMPSIGPEHLGTMALNLSDYYQQCAQDSVAAVALLSSPDIAHKLRVAVQKLGTACIELVKIAGKRKAHPNDQWIFKELQKASSSVIDGVQEVLAALHEGSKGTQACINAANTVSGIIGDLDTTIMFATSGSLNTGVGSGQDTFASHRETILKTAKALIEDTKALVSGAASNQEQLAVAAQNAVKTILNLTESVKNSASSLNSEHSEAQVMVIHAVRDVAASLAHLIQSTKNASGKSLHDPAMNSLKEAAKGMVFNVTGLLKTVKVIENESQRGTRALEAAIEAIENEIRIFDSGEGHIRENASPEDIFRASKSVGEATSKAANAANTLTQEDLITSANLARGAVHELLLVARSIGHNVDNAELRYKINDNGREVALQIKTLLTFLLHILLKNGFDISAKNNLIYAAQKISQLTGDLINCGESMKGDDEWGTNDPTIIAENELLGAATSIEAAAIKLAQLKPRRHTSEITRVDENLPFDEHILSASHGITNAVKTLVRAASEAQKELVSQGRLDPNPTNPHSQDYQWSEGLISAARMVVAAVHQLCGEANNVVLGRGTEEKLISAAKQVASSTAHLLVACKVKSDIGSLATQRLQAAGNAVKTATESLVAAAKQTISTDERPFKISQSLVNGISQVWQATTEVYTKERELKEAREKLATINKQRYERSGTPDAI
uniref:FERM domain-containing protein n=1 Tax=Rhabditophanes sp. KR3021 TaxID=114890 RepID=A0AC35TN27_9BILA